MKLEQTAFVTEISGFSAFDELPAAQTGQPCLLLVHMPEQTDLTPEVQAFLAEAPFLTALVSDAPDAEAAAYFDLTIAPAALPEYTEMLFREMTPEQAAEITNCFVIARKGSAQDVLDAESRAFYRLIAAKTGETAYV